MTPFLEVFAGLALNELLKGFPHGLLPGELPHHDKTDFIFLLFAYPFFIYIEYRSAFYHGFHDSNRRNAPDSKSYLFKGALAGFISAIPMIVLIIVYVVFYDNVFVSQSAKLYARVIAMYYNWPMCNIFPNHTLEVLLSSLAGLIVFPMIGYIAGYKNFVISDKIYKALKITPSK